MLRSFLLALLLCTAVVLADLHDPNNRADYMIVTTDELIENYPWITELALWRGEHGRIPIVVSTEEVWNEFGGGVPSDTALKAFLHFARLNWQPPQLKDVFIIGYHDVVPSHVVQDSSFYYPDSTYTVFSYLSDFYYAADPDSINPVPVLGIGRLPWSSGQTSVLPNFFAKIQAYELAPADLWQHRVQLIADDSDSHFDFANDFSEPLATLVPSNFSIERDYLDYAVGHPWHGDHEEVMTHMNAGNFITSYLGHGGGGIWSAQRLMDSVYAASLTNSARLPIIISETVYDGSLSHMGPLALAMIFNLNGGAIGYFASTYAAWANAGNIYARILYETVFSDTTRTLGDLWRRGEYRFVHEYPWSAGPFNPNRMVATESMLLGDPGLRLPDRTTEVTELMTAFPSEIRLEPNYPNPFNATTRITYRLSHSTEISLKVFDVLGREVSDLARGLQAAGEHVVSFNAEDRATGIYFVVLQTSDVKQVQKMILIK